MLVTLGALGVAAAGLLALFVRSVIDLRIQWRRAAAEVGLEDVAVSVQLGTRLVVHGHRGPLEVLVAGWLAPNSESRHPLDITVEGLQSLPPTLSLCSRSMRSLVEALTSADDYLVGDPAFDEEFLVRGRPEVTLVVLDKDLRLDLCALAARGGVRVGNGSVTLRLQHVPTTQQEAVSFLQAVLSVAESLSRPVQLPASLEGRFREEPLSSVRRQQVRTLGRGYLHDARARTTLVSACTDPNDDVRIEAATALGEEGREALLEIAERPGQSEPVAVRALEAMGASLPAERGLALLDASLRAGRRLVARAVLADLGRRGGPEVVPRIATVLAVEHGDMAVAAAEALGQAGGVGAEDALALALQRQDEAVRRAAAVALGKAGTVRSVPVLVSAVNERPADWWFRRDARAAVAAIQARVLGADRGRLSLASPEGGHVSLATDVGEVGRLSEVGAAGDEQGDRTESE